MAIFQPTSIIPSSFTQGTVDAVKDNMEVSWQVNGNSAMTAFQIDFYLNDTASTFVYSTGKLGTTQAEQAQYNLPFYGTDRFGRPQFFTYNANESWNDKNSGFTNGNNYKFKITQWYEGANEVIGNITADVTAGTTYYFTVSGGGIVYFAPAKNINNAAFFFSLTNGEGWYVISSEYRPIPMFLSSTDIHQDGWVSLGAGAASTQNEIFLSQISDSDFITRTTPTLALQISDNENYTNPVALGDVLATSIGYFVADYQQAQGDPIRWIRWQVATANNGVVGGILADTGDVYTPTLNFEFNGFFNGNQYAIRCFGESESGQSCDTDWQFFNINFTQNTYDGNFTAQCLHKENATLLEWEGITVIPPTVSPEDYKPTLGNGSVTLLPKSGDTEYSVTWDKVGSKEGGLDTMNFEPNWAAVWKGRVQQTQSDIIGFNSIQRIPSDTGYLLKYSPDGNLLLYYNFGTQRLLLYAVGVSQLTLIGYLRSDGSISNTPVTYYGAYVMDVAFNGNGLFAVSTQNSLFLYSYNNGGFTLLDSTGIDTRGTSVAFSPDGGVLVRGGTASYNTLVYSVANNELEELYPLQHQDANIVREVSTIDFNKDGTLLCMGFSSLSYGDLGVAVFDVNGTQITYKEDIITNEECFNLAFNKGANPNVLIVATELNYYQFQIVDNEPVLISSITNSPIVYQAISRAISFSPDGNDLLIGGQSSVSWYSIQNNTFTYKGSVALPNGASWNNAIAIDWNAQINQIAIHNDGTSAYFHQIYEADFSNVEYLPQGNLFELKYGEVDLITFSRQDNPLILKLGDTQLASIAVPNNSTSVTTVITPTALNAYFYDNNGLISQSSTPTTYTQQPITSVSIYGGDSGATVESVSIYQGDGSNILSLYQNDPNFEPVWNDPNYQLYMTANFNGNLEGGTGTSSGKGFQIYRQEVGKNVLTPIANVSSTTTSLKDYGISSRKVYKYSLYAYDSNSAFMGGVEADNVIATNFKNYSLLVCDYDYDKDEYHVRKQYLFALNLSTGSVGNNNSPTLNKNFTQYPTVMRDTANYKSGTLSGLIGAIYTVPALIEQIGQYKWTAKPSTLDYFDSVDLEKELYDLSTAPYQLFLRDMKGRLRMIATSSQINMQDNIKQKQLSTTISFPWVEVGDASDVTIIQTPDDYGWNNDNQVLDVQLDVDVETGELSATYPFPYNGTKFYLTGVNKDNLTAKTPLGVTPAQFNLSDTATETTDGEVTATVKVNSEVNE